MGTEFNNVCGRDRVVIWQLHPSHFIYFPQMELSDFALRLSPIKLAFYKNESKVMLVN